MHSPRFLSSLLIVGLMMSCQSIAANQAALPELALNNGCFTCHAIDRKVIGPAWRDVAAKYRGDANAEDRLVRKVSAGGKGVWGNEMAMPPFAPYMKEVDIRTLVKYVLSLK